MKKLVILLTVLSSWMYVSAEEYTLDGIQQLARANYPAIRQFELIDRIADFSLANTSSAWAPQISLSGQATYQSDVVSFPESMTDVFSMLGVDISGLHKDQYKLALNIEQTLWDGGYTKSRKEAVLAEKEVSSKSVEVELYALADKVNQLYFGILVLDEQLRLNDLTAGILWRITAKSSSPILTMVWPNPQIWPRSMPSSSPTHSRGPGSAVRGKPIYRCCQS